MSAKDRKPDFEKQLKRLQQVVQELEEGDLPLEKGVALYKEGMVLAKACREQLATAKHEISVLAADGSLTPLDDAGEGASDEEKQV